MSVITFKILLLISFELVFGIAYLLLNLFNKGNITFDFLQTFSLLTMLSIPIFIILPDYNWIWLIEEDSRSKKPQVREKASKHLHLSILYTLLLAYPIFLFTLTLIIRNTHYIKSYTFFLTLISVCYGLITSILTYQILKNRTNSLAVGWDRMFPFFHPVIETTFPRTKHSIFGRKIFPGVIFLSIILFLPPVYFQFFPQALPEFDKTGWLIIYTVHNIGFSLSVWFLTNYISFQLLYNKSIYLWYREEKVKNKRKKDEQEANAA